VQGKTAGSNGCWQSSDQVSVSMNSMFIGALDHHSTFYGDNDFDVIERLAERGIAALSLEAWEMAIAS